MIQVEASSISSLEKLDRLVWLSNSLETQEFIAKPTVPTK